jgi:hypothetical protein
VPRDPESNGHPHARPNRRRGGNQESSSTADIPFRDANTDIGEIPIDELDTFVIPGTDDRGVGEHVHLRLPPYVRRQIKIILGSNRFPYLTEAALIRHAIVRQLYWLVDLRNSIPKHILPALAGVLEVCRDDEMRIQVEHVFQKIDDRIHFHLSRGDHAEVIRLLNLVKSRMTGVQPSAWQRQFWEHFNQKWAGYLSPTPDGNSKPGVH